MRRCGVSTQRARCRARCVHVFHRAREALRARLTMGTCATLKAFAQEQLERVQPHVLNASLFSYKRQGGAAGLALCVIDGRLFYQESHDKHLWHGEADRAWGALQVVWQWLRRSGWRGPPRCWQHSGRDDQRYGQSLGLPTMLWHYDSHQPHEAAFLWPEHNYEGEITRTQPPTRTFRSKLVDKPWSDRRDMMRYRGSKVGNTRREFLACGHRNESHFVGFFTSRTDIAQIDWFDTHDNVTLANLNHGMHRFSDYKHITWLPGGADWSSGLNQFMAYGSALYMPADLNESHSLNTKMLLERCDRCVVAFNRRRSGGTCDAFAEAFLLEEASGSAELIAGRLSRFVRTELHPDCVDQYLTAIVDGLPQTVIESEAVTDATSPLVAKCNPCRGMMAGWPRGWREFSCRWMLSYATDIIPHVGADERRANVNTSLSRWWDPTCANDRDDVDYNDEEEVKR